VVVLAVAVLITIVWYLASRTSRSSAGQDSPAAVANTSAAPTMTGVLANSTSPSRSTVPSPSPSPSAPTDSAASVSGSPTGAASATDAAPPAATESAAPDPAATDAAAAGPAPATDAPPPASPEAAPAPPPPSYDADGKLLCPDAAIGLAATVPAEVKSGANVIVGMTVTNTGTEACRRDVSGTIQVFTVFGADGSRLWSTADCFPGQGTEVRELTPGQTLEYTVKWSGTTSAPGCTGDRVRLAPGSYTLIAQLGPVASSPASFTVV
jgi:hypothetical protein